jgi:hypothetical protein
MLRDSVASFVPSCLLLCFTQVGQERIEKFIDLSEKSAAAAVRRFVSKRRSLLWLDSAIFDNANTAVA